MSDLNKLDKLSLDPEPKEEKKEEKPTPKRHPFLSFIGKTIGFLLILILLAILGAGTCAGLLLYWASRDLPNIKRVADYRPPQATTVLDQSGNVIGTFAHERRYVIPIKDMSKYLPMAFLASEDDAFYSHLGVDPMAIARAAINNFRKGHTGEGGSTITQQLIKQLLLTSERSYTRKMKEAILAYQLEKNLSKDDILTIYLNHIYLGEHSYGVEAAARTYFGKHASDITLAESAVIAGLPKAPSSYNPFRHPEAAKTRQRYVLGRMRDLRWISENEYQKAISEPLVYWSMPERQDGAASWYLEEVRRMLIEFFTEDNLRALGVDTRKYGEDYVYEAGLTVYTRMNPTHQEAASKAVRKGLEAVDKRQGWRGPIARLTKVQQEEFLTKHAFSPIDLAGGAWTKALVTAVQAKQVQVNLGQGYIGTIPVSQMSWARKPNPRVSGFGGSFISDCRRVLSVGDLIYVNIRKATEKNDKKEKGPAAFDPQTMRKGQAVQLTLQQEPLVQGALVSIEPRSGDVVALIGGYQYGNTQFNRATQARRQPGSSFKPIVYSTALDNGFTPFSVVLDGPFVYVNPYTREVWRPNNSEHNYKGEIPLYLALALSRNTCAVRVAQQIGIENVIERAKLLGLEPNFPKELAVSLGAVGVTPLNMTQAYAAFANQGLGVRPRMVSLIKDSEGKELYKQEVEHWQAISPQNAFIMDTMLKNAVNTGTGRRARIEGRFIGGKTGTSNQARDAWFIGFSPYLVTGVYVGYDKVQPLGRTEQGGRTAAPIFKDYRDQVEDLYPVEDFLKPDNVTLSGNFAYQSDMPYEGSRATSGTLSEEVPVSPSDSGEDLMRQMF
ncbi:MAG: PBP1A family penicillin-binding protein [Desulfovibrio sp.]|nr:PBP1A family penicillin-binding protein [Desulfovibrio sp.]